MNKAKLLNQITAIRVMLDNLEEEVRKEKDKPQCDHRNVRNLTTMGGPEEWICKDCGEHYRDDQKEGEE
jgi:transposase-like protein